MRNYLIYLLPFLLIAVSCGDEDDVLPDFLSGEGGFFEISPNFGVLDIVQFEASGNWYVYVDYKSSDENWIDISPTMGESGKYVLSMTVSNNDTEAVREADVVVKCSNSQIVYTIRQEAKKVEPIIIPEGGLDLIRSVKIEEYEPGNVLKKMSVVNFDYDECLRLVSAEIDADGEGHMVDVYYDSGNKYVSFDFGEWSTKFNLSSDGLVEGGDWGASFVGGYLQSFCGYDIIWNDGNISSICGNENTVAISSDSNIPMSGNFYLDIMLVYGLVADEIITVTDVMPMFQREFLGKASVFMPSLIEMNGMQYMYVYASDDYERIVEIHEYEIGEEGTDTYIHRRYMLNYVYEQKKQTGWSALSLKRDSNP